METNRIIITGGAGFIGSTLAEVLLGEGREVLVLDSLTDFYPVAEKNANLEALQSFPAFRFEQIDLQNSGALEKAVSQFRPQIVVHLAASAGVRPSLQSPAGYFENNLMGTLNLLECIRQRGAIRLINGSSSSVYGVNDSVPFREDDAVLSQISPYAASKLAAESLCHVFSSTHGIQITSLRFFTVYGPRQRPDLAIRKFMGRILRGEKIQLYGDGSSSRDYTYVDDIAAGIRAAIDWNQQSVYDCFNLGNSRPLRLTDLLAAIEETLGRKADVEFTSEQKGDVRSTWASIDKASETLGYHPATSMTEGLARMHDWLIESGYWKTDGKS